MTSSQEDYVAVIVDGRYVLTSAKDRLGPGSAKYHVDLRRLVKWIERVIGLPCGAKAFVDSAEGSNSNYTRHAVDSGFSYAEVRMKSNTRRGAIGQVSGFGDFTSRVQKGVEAAIVVEATQHAVNHACKCVVILAGAGELYALVSLIKAELGTPFVVLHFDGHVNKTLLAEATRAYSLNAHAEHLPVFNEADYVPRVLYPRLSSAPETTTQCVADRRVLRVTCSGWRSRPTPDAVYTLFGRGFIESIRFRLSKRDGLYYALVQFTTHGRAAVAMATGCGPMVPGHTWTIRWASANGDAEPAPMPVSVPVLAPVFQPAGTTMAHFIQPPRSTRSDGKEWHLPFLPPRSGAVLPEITVPSASALCNGASPSGAPPRAAVATRTLTEDPVLSVSAPSERKVQRYHAPGYSATRPVPDGAPDMPSAPATLYLTGVRVDSGIADIREVFELFGDIIHILVQRPARKAPVSTAKVQFVRRSDADRAIRALQGNTRFGAAFGITWLGANRETSTHGVKLYEVVDRQPPIPEGSSPGMASSGSISADACCDEKIQGLLDLGLCQSVRECELLMVQHDGRIDDIISAILEGEYLEEQRVMRNKGTSLCWVRAVEEPLAGVVSA